MARTSVAKRKIDEDGGSVAFDFSETGGDVVVVRLDDFTPAIQRQLALHGISQKCGDAWSKAGEIADPEKRTIWAMDQLASVVKLLVAGDWKAARAAGEGASPLLVEALFRFMEAGPDPKGMDECKAVVESLDKDGKSGLRKAVAVQYAAIQAERAKIKAEDPTLSDPTALFGASEATSE